MAKWLDKYEQGGLVLKKKTKDNYGKKPNVNDVKVSAGPGFEGDGYTAQNWKSPAWGGQFQNGGFLQPNSSKLPEGYVIPYNTPSTELAMSIGGEEGEPAYLIPSFKGGKKLKDPIAEYKKTGEHLGGPFKTWQEAEKFGEMRHEYVEKGQSLPSPLKWWGDMAMGGSMPGSVGFMYARTQNPAPANGKYTKKTLASAQDGMEMPKAELTPDIRKSKLSTAIKSGTQNPTATNLETDSFGQAYKKARKQGKTKFSYQGKDYSTKYKGTPEEQLKQTGITDAQLHDKNVIQEQLAKNLMPVGYDKLNAIGSLFTKNADRKDLEKLAKTNEGLLWGVWTPEDAKRRLDAFNLYSGIPQKYNTFSISKNKPSVSKDKDAIYYSITNDKLRKYLEERIATYDLNAQKDIPAQFREFDNSIQYIPGTKNKVILEDDSGVMGNFTATLGKDEKGDYVSYYDKWDISPKDFGKPMEIYDKIYLKDLIKDYKPKLQNGKALSPDADDRSLLGFNTPDPAFQNVKANAFVPFDRKDFEGIRQNIAGYMNSPLYMERLSKSIPDAENAKDVQQRRLNNLLGIKLNPDYVDDGTHYNANQNRINVGARDFVDNSIIGHELAHGVVPNITNSYGKQNIFAKAANVVGDLFQPYEQFSNSELEKINIPLSGKITTPNFDYRMARKEEHYKPQGSKASAKTAANETYGDLTGMRQLLLDNGITTEFGQELTPEIFKKAKENKRVINSPTFKRMKLKFKDEDIIKMNNEVAYNDDNAPLDQAQNGKEMSFYQNGLDFKPKSISKKGKKIIKDDMGQWAHPGEVTEIGSPDITMQGVDYPVLGISDTGDTQMMYPDQDYKFDGDKVTEFPMMNKGGWLDKYKAQSGKTAAPYGSLQGDLPEVVVTSTKPSKWGKFKFAPYDPSKNPESISQWNPKPGEREALAAAEQARRDEENSFYNNKHFKSLRNSAFADWRPYALAGGITALPAISSALGLGSTGAALTAPMAGVPGLTGANVLGVGSVAYGASKVGNTSESVMNAYNNPTRENILNAINEVGWNALDFAPAVPTLKTIGQEAKGLYNTVATGESALPIAWKSPAVGLSQESSADMFRGIANANKLSDADRALLLEYQYDSKPFTGRWGTIDQSKRKALNDLIKNNELTINNNAILTRRFNPENQSLGAEFVGNELNLGDRPTSFSAGIGLPTYGSGATNRLVVPNRYAKQMGSNLLANEYGIPSDETFSLLNDKGKNFAASIGVNPTDMINAEREVIGTGLDFRKIGKVKNDIGGYDYIVKPKAAPKSKPTINKNEIAGSVVEGNRKIFYNELGDEVGSIESFPDIDAQRNINWGPTNEKIPEPRTIANPDYTDIGNRYLQNNDPFNPTSESGLKDIPIAGGSTTKTPGSKAGFPNPLDIVDEITPRLDPVKLFGIQGDIMDLSPLNLIPGYGKKLAGQNQTFRKFGNSIQDVIERQALSPKGGSNFRMGKDQIVREGNWAARGEPNENYSGVFEATFDLNNPAANLSASGSPTRNGVLMMDKEGRLLPDIPLTEPGMSFNRRLPFSTRYVPIDKQKLINNQFQFATMAPRLQSLVEKYGLGLGAATLMGTDAVNTYNKYTIDPVIDMAKKLELDKLGLNFKAPKDTSSKKQNGGWLDKYK